MVLKNQKGFTMVEILVVIALISLITLFALPNVTSILKITLNTATRELATAIKETAQSTILTGRMHRIVYDLEENEFWVESAPNDTLLDTEKSYDKEVRRRKMLGEPEKPASPFQIDKSVTRKKISLPSGVTFKAIYSTQKENPIETGVAYTHFFPQGMIEPTLIHITDLQDHQISIVISSLVGRVKVMNGFVGRREAFGL